KGRANLLVFANIDAANAAYNITRAMTDGVGLGPILMGLSKSAHVLTPSATIRRIVNMTAVAAVDALIRAERAV
ncbi:MAG: phosphate acyltransferase, partial [Silanimonas sp.]